MSNLYWDRDNEPMTDVLLWARRFEDPGYRIIAYDVEGSHAVSTVWQGMDMSHNPDATGETAMIFETAFLIDDVIVDKVVWHTESGAMGGHAMMCVKLLGRLPRPADGHRDELVRRKRRA